jgi:hypothetical protein
MTKLTIEVTNLRATLMQNQREFNERLALQRTWMAGQFTSIAELIQETREALQQQMEALCEAVKRLK